MKLRHAAVLALVGWYLMFPPTTSETAWICGQTLSAGLARDWFGWGKGCGTMTRLVDGAAPLSAWHQSGEPFERLSECEKVRAQLLQSELADNSGKPLLQWTTQMELAKCVASDDPRLKK